MIQKHTNVQSLDQLFLDLDTIENSLGDKLKELVKHHGGRPYPIIVGKSKIVIDVIRATDIPSPDITHIPQAYCTLTVDKALVNATVIADPTRNPVWHDHFEMDIVKSKPSRQQLGKKLDLETIKNTYFYFQISSKNSTGGDDYLAYVGLSGNEVVKMCEEVTTGIKFFDAIPVIPQSPSKRKAKLALRFNVTGHIPLIYDKVLVAIVNTRQDIEKVYKNAIELLRAGHELNEHELASKIRSYRDDIQKIDIMLKKEVPHSLYCGLYDQLAEMKTLQETITKLAEKAKVKEKRVVVERNKAQKCLSEADTLMHTTKNVSKIRYSLIQKVRSAVEDYVSSTTRQIARNLSEQQHTFLVKMQGLGRRNLVQRINVSSTKEIKESVDSSELAIRELKDRKISASDNYYSIIRTAQNSLDDLREQFMKALTVAILRDWNTIYEQSSKSIQTKHGSHAKEMRKKSNKEDKYREAIKNCRKQLNELQEMQEEFALSQAIVKPLQEMHKILKDYSDCKKEYSELEAISKRKRGILVDFQKNAASPVSKSSGRTSSSIDVRIRKIKSENEQMIAALETVDKEIEKYKIILKTSPWKKKMVSNVNKVIASNRMSKAKGREKSRKSRSDGLPPGWKAYKDKNTGQTYYHNRKMGKTQWILPK